MQYPLSFEKDEKNWPMLMHPMEKTQTVICGHFITAENRGFGDGVGSRRKRFGMGQRV